MGANDQDVKVGLTIQEDGEPKAFEDAAQGVSDLAATSEGAAPSLASLAEALGALAQSSDGTAEAKAAFSDFAASLKDFANAGNLSEQKDAVDSALEAWRRFGDEVPDLLGKSDKAAKDYQKTLDMLTEQQRKLGEPVEQSLDQAQRAFEKLDGTIQATGTASVKKLAELRQRIDDYRKALEDARAAGTKITGDQEAELQRLQEGYDSASKAVARYSASKKEAARQLEADKAATTGEAKSISSLKDLVVEAVPSWGKYAAAATAVVGAFEAGWAAGGKLREVLNALSGGEFDRQVQGFFQMQQAADAYVEAIDGVAAAELRANQQRSFLALGLKGFSEDLAANARILQEYATRLHDARTRGEELALATHKLAEAHGVDTLALGKQSEALLKEISLFELQNTQLSRLQVGAIFKEDVQKALDGYAKLNQQAPAALQRLAAEWGVTTTAVEKHKAAVDKIIQQITGLSQKSAAELAADAKALEDAFSHINLGHLNFDELTRARAQVQALIDEYTKAGQAIPASLAKIAQEVGAFQSASDLMASKVDRNSKLVNGYAESLGKSAGAAGQAASASAAAATDVQKLGDAAQTAGAHVQALHVSASTGRKEITNEGAAADDAAKGVTNLGTAAQTTGAHVQALHFNAATGRKEITNEGQAAQDAAKGVTELGQAAKSTSDEVTRTTQIFDANGKLIYQATARTKEAAEALEKAGQETTHVFQTFDANGKLLEESVTRVGRGVSDVTYKMTPLKDAMDGVSGKGGELIDRVNHVGDSFDQMKEKIQSALGGVAELFIPLLAQLDMVIEKAGQAATEVAAVAAAGQDTK